jgi:hypothetical protein
VPRISFPYFRDTDLIQDVPVDLFANREVSRGPKGGAGGHTSTPTLIKAYRYAKLRAIWSLDELKSASASVPRRTAMLSHATHAGGVDGQFWLECQPGCKAQDSLRSLANQTLPSTRTGVAIFLGTRTSEGTELIAR